MQCLAELHEGLVAGDVFPLGADLSRKLGSGEAELLSSFLNPDGLIDTKTTFQNSHAGP